LDPKTPLFIDDPSQINQVDESLNKKLKTVIERV
jgi:small subunit ribosomal protein S9